jgi:hypothetical protein
LLQSLPIQNHKGSKIVRSGEQNWTPPSCYQGIQEWEEQKAKQKAENEKRAQEAARIRAHQQKIHAIKAKMPKE